MRVVTVNNRNFVYAVGTRLIWLSACSSLINKNFQLRENEGISWKVPFFFWIYDVFVYDIIVPLTVAQKMCTKKWDILG